MSKVIQKIEDTDRRGVSALGKAGCAGCSRAGLNVCMCPPQKAGGPVGRSGAGTSGSPVGENKPGFFSSLNRVVINELLTRHLLEIDLSNDLMTLAIKCNPRLTHAFSSEEKVELNRLIQMMQVVLNQFKKENHLFDADLQMDLRNDKQNSFTSLTLQMKQMKHFHLFNQLIALFIKNELLPTQVTNPILMKPTFAMKKGKQIDTSEEEEVLGVASLRSPFASLKDGPKPRGVK